MSRLTKKPPESASMDGATYPLNTNFRNCIDTIMLLEDDEVLDHEKAEILIENMYSEPRPTNVNEAVRQAVSYLMQYRETDKEERRRPVLLDFSQDGQYIYDAFLKKGINLDEAEMTFFEFMSHLRELPDGCFISRLVYLRQLVSDGKINKKEHRHEKEECKKIGWHIVNIENKETDGEHSEEYDKFMRLLKGGV